MRTAGWTYQAIADELGYANRGAVHNIVAAALKTHTAKAVKELQQLESARRYALQYALWDTALNGDLPAAVTIMRIIQARCSLYGLTGQKSPMTREPRRRTVPVASDAFKGSLTAAQVAAALTAGLSTRK